MVAFCAKLCARPSSPSAEKENANDANDDEYANRAARKQARCNMDDPAWERRHPACSGYPACFRKTEGGRQDACAPRVVTFRGALTSFARAAELTAPRQCSG